MAAKKPISPNIVWTVSILLAVLFGGFGVFKIVDPQLGTAPVQNPMPDLYRWLLGGAFCVGAVLLLVPRFAWIGALWLVLLLGGACVWFLSQGQLAGIVIPLLFIVSLGTLAYVRRPGSTALTPPP